jgi:1-acyl-sn-glycerol-3-phosphate acyltransferase
MIPAIIKIPAFLTVLSGYILFSLLGELFIRDKEKRRIFFMRTTSVASGLGLWILNIRINSINKEIIKANGPFLVISNHLSYLDILILSSLNPSLFITSVEVQHSFFLGMMARLGGSLFVERRSKTRLLEEVDRIADVLSRGFTITLFPEGTSSNGERVLPFKGALFRTAEKASVEILPVCIKYLSINMQPVDEKNRDLAYYYGDISFFPHLVKLFFVKRIDVSVSYIDKISINSRERKDLVEEVYEKIRSEYESSSI